MAAEQKSQHRNHLQDAKSPYLLQHADNPVDWYPWGEKAFEKAKKEDKPIFLSIGYSTCHWCHVMAHESFEDEEVAVLMNEAFVNIKLDREERPDIDSIYMTACHLTGQRGGWPLTVIMTPDKKPFYIATYIPKTGLPGRAGMMQLVPAIQHAWQTERDKITESADSVVTALQQQVQSSGGDVLSKESLTAAFSYFEQSFDGLHGGFGTAPKFPTPHNLLFLLRYWKRSGDPNALEMVEKTLTQMRLGGVYDHVGFGFHRYATDHKWFLPHFEKMLYDQAMLAMAYCEAYQATGNEFYADTVREIFTYVLRDMTDPTGGFYSAEDADSEGEEGKFYLWKYEEILDILGAEEGELFAEVYNITKEGNYYEEASGHQPGTNIPHLGKPLSETAAERKMEEKTLRQRLEAARQKLFVVREKRVHPGKDDKVLTDWNGLMIAALAKGARVLDEPKYKQAAQKAAAFLTTTMTGDKGRLHHRYRNGHAGLQGNIDDYAFVIWGLLELYETDFDVTHLERAIALAKTADEHYWDKGNSGYYFSPDDGEALIARQKEIYDGAVPSGNSVMMLNLIKLARLTGNTNYEKQAVAIGKAFSDQVAGREGAYSLLMCGLDFLTGPAHEIVIAGKPAAADTRAMIVALNKQYLPNKVVLLRDSDNPAALAKLADYTEYQQPLDGKATVYVCQNFTCQAPTTDTEKMLTLLRAQ